MTQPVLVAREAERAIVDRIVDDVSVRGSVLVVRGEAGVGKSSLLAAVTARAEVCEVTALTTSGFQSEAHLRFAGLHQLIRPLLAGVNVLPPPQRAALEAALGVNDETPSEFFLIALAALELLAD